MAEISSPDRLVLRKTPTVGSRLGGRGKLVIGGVLLLVVVMVVFGIESRRERTQASEQRASSEAQLRLAPARTTAASFNAQAGDDVVAVTAAAARARSEAEQAAREAQSAPPVHSAGVPYLGAGGSVPAIEAESERLLREQELLVETRARQSGMGVNGWSSETSGPPAPSASGAGAQPQAMSPDMLAELQRSAGLMSAGLGGGNGEGAGPGQAEKRAFFNDAATLSAPRLAAYVTPAPTPYQLTTGAAIQAVTLQRMVSDLPGEMTAMVTEHVYDSATGRHVLIPQGSRLFGRYDSEVAFGQRRIQAAWQRIIFPDGSTLELGGMKGLDASGGAGFEDRVNNHLGRLIGYGALTSVMGAAFQLSQPRSSGDEQLSSREVIAGEVGRDLTQLGIEVTRRNLNVQPTITIRPGYRFVVMVNQDIAFPAPYIP